MDNPKIITVNRGTEVSVFGNKHSYTTTHTQNFIVNSETETHFFYLDSKGTRISVSKNNIKKITFKNRKILFKDLKKDEIINVFDNYRKLIITVQKMSKMISEYKITENDMSIYDSEELHVGMTKKYIVLYKNHYHQGEIIEFRCHIPKKYLWDHSWRKNLKAELEKTKHVI